MRLNVDNAIRLQYLAALGIDVWIPRKVGPVIVQSLPTVVDEPLETIEPRLVIDEADEAVEEPYIEINLTEQWGKLKAEVQNCTLCGLCHTRTQTVFGTGNQQADWLIIGEAPGQQEDEQGLPFVGVAGQLLTEMLRAIGLNRDDVFIANILKCRPPNNRDPHIDEIKSCHDYLQRQQQLIKPKIMLAVGRVAAQALLNTTEPLAKLRGKVHTLNDTPVVVVYHPAYLLRSLSEKRKAWQDLQLAKQTVIAMENEICVD
jgi:DNA polymerase